MATKKDSKTKKSPAKSAKERAVKAPKSEAPAADSSTPRREGPVASLPVVNLEGKEVGTVDLNPAVFGVEVNEALVHDTVRWQLARRRAGTHSALTRSMIIGGKKKPFKQKHTGRARQGSTVGPHMVGGAVVHGPLPRSYDYRLPKRTRRQALASVLSEKVLANRLVIVDALELKEAKTKIMAGVLGKIGVAGSAAIVVPAMTDTVARSSRNLAKVIALPAGAANVYDLLRHDFLVCTKDGVKALEERVLKE